MGNAQLGVCYWHGRGVPADDREAVRLSRLAAEQGDADGQFNFGFCCRDGVGVPQDDGEAARLFRLAAEQRDESVHERARAALGEMLTNGRCSGELSTQVREGARLLAYTAQHAEDEYARQHALVVLLGHVNERGVVQTCCIGCGKTRALKVCSKCHVAKFCGAECARHAWPVHKPGCRRFAAEEAAASCVAGASGSSAPPCERA